jgi:hypothetical protein
MLLVAIMAKKIQYLDTDWNLRSYASYVKLARLRSLEMH